MKKNLHHEKMQLTLRAIKYSIYKTGTMKSVDLHSTKSKKKYVKPVLRAHGNVMEITKGGSGGSADLDENQKLA